MENGELQKVYRQFIEDFCNEIDNGAQEDNDLPFRPYSSNLMPSELEGECLEWIRRYLSQHNCPEGLISQLTREVFTNFDDSIKLSEYYVEVLDRGSNNKSNKDDNIDDDSSHSSSVDGDQIEQAGPPKLDAFKLLLHLVSHVHATVQSWRSAPPAFTCNPTTLRVCSHAIKNTRRKMEDKHVVIRDLNALYDLKDSPPQSYFAIFDGHGGVDAAMYAATHLHGHLVSDKLFHADPATAMKHAYKTTDIKFLEKAKRENLRSGTTGISVLIRGSDLYLGWLGDSQAVLVCAGRPAQIMEPHKPEREDEKRRIEDLGGSVLFIGVWRVNGNISVSRAIGDATHKPFISSDADVKSIKLTEEEEYLVIACDGLWDVLTPAQVTQIVYDHVHSSPDGLDDVASLLVKAARDSGSSDNISVIVVFFQTSLTDPASVTDSSCLLKVTEHSDSAKDRSTKSTSVDPVVPKPTLSANEKVKTKNYKMGQSQTRSKGSIMKSISLYLSSAAHCWHS